MEAKKYKTASGLEVRLGFEEKGTVYGWVMRGDGVPVPRSWDAITLHLCGHNTSEADWHLEEVKPTKQISVYLFISKQSTVYSAEEWYSLSEAKQTQRLFARILVNREVTEGQME